MTWLPRRVRHWPLWLLWLLIPSAPGAIAQADTKPPTTPIEVPAPNAGSADPRPDSDLPESDVPESGPSDDALLREPAGPSSANESDGGDDFKPSEQISEDFSISLPVDI